MPKELIAETGAVVYRTKLIRDEARALSVARSLAANSRFDSVVVVACRQARSGGYYVQFRPTNTERADGLVLRQQDARVQRAVAEGGGYLFLPDEDTGRFFWCLSPSGEVYETCAAGCSCPDFQYRCAAAGLSCKHMIALGLFRRGLLGRAA